MIDPGNLKQIKAIKMSTEIGGKLIEDFSGILDGYVNGNSFRELVEGYNLMVHYNITYAVAVNALKEAVRLNLPVFKRRVLETKIKSRNGIKTYQNSKGIHALSSEEKVKFGRQGGLKGGPNSVIMKKGIHGLSLEQRIEHARKVASSGGRRLYELGKGIFNLTRDELVEYGKKASLSRGETPWSEEEKRVFLNLCEDKFYQHTKAQYIGKPNYTLISIEMECTFGIQRSESALKSARNNWKRKKKLK